MGNGQGPCSCLQPISITEASHLCVLYNQSTLKRRAEYKDSSTDFPGGSDGEVSAYNVGDPGSIPGLGRSPREGNGNLLQYSCLENAMDRGTWQATVHRVANSQTRLSDFTFTFY